MPSEDAIRWNRRYLDGLASQPSGPRGSLLGYMDRLPSAGRALDIATGLGHNAGALLAHGLTVIAVDISSVAIRKAQRRYPGLHLVIADCSDLHFIQAQFDVITNYYYLERPLFNDFQRLLKPGGHLIVETLTQEIRTIHPDIDPRYLLEPGELREAFDVWEILDYFEGWLPAEHGNTKAITRLFARRPTDR